MSRPDWVERLFSVDPILGEDDADLGITLLLARIGTNFSSNIHSIPRESQREILGIAEEVLESGDEEEKAAIATGFLEEILKAWDEGFDLKSLWEFVGPRSRSFCLDWNEFSGVASPEWMHQGQ
ncbi:hypothetical protein [Kitasatospora sp. SUK 42]|uniref:DUF7674 family protein n=1 Tax=Kitasatospora sp. SUK 42 TaxID=1588882 RepID=UPI001C3191CE|nr:hypothetical protein [Kitasatospora sp. SUK 42]MBV2155628.1 hypothetical protein [Kitasatospora sp. SUK 42]